MFQTNKDDYMLGEKSAWFGIQSNLFLFAIKLFAGVYGRSQAMMADAFHTASDALTSVGVLVGFKIAAKPPDEHHPFGHGRAESIVAKLISVVLILVGFSISIKAARVLLSGEMGEPGSIALIVAALSVIVKEIAYRRVISSSKAIDSSSLKADAYHHRSDAISSIAALIGILGAKLGYTYMDPLAGVIVGAFIIKMGAGSFHEAYDELMDAAPPKELEDRIKHLVCEAEGVLAVKKVMIRKAGIDLYPEITIGVDGDSSVKEGHLVTVKIKQILFREMKRVKNILVHVEPSDEDD